MCVEYKTNEEGEYVCQICGSIKKHQSTMYYHMKAHEKYPFPYTCKICTKGFIQKQTLELHMSSRHSSHRCKTGPKLYSCPEKGCSFVSLSRGSCCIHYARAHCHAEVQKLIKTTPDGQLLCQKCNKVFSEKGGFYYHYPSCVQLPIASRNAVQETGL